MNETLNCIKNRYSCRGFLDKAILDEDLEAIALAGNQAPTAMNRQHYKIIMLNNKQLIAQLDEEGVSVMRGLEDKSSYERIMSRGGKMLYNAAAVAILPIKKTSKRGLELIDLGIVAQNIVLAATSLGIDSCHCGMLAFSFLGEHKEEFRKKLNIPCDYECDYGVLLGYAKNKASPHTPDNSKISFIK